MFHHFEDLGTVFCCYNDDFFTFKSEYTIISGLVGYSRSEIETLFENRFLGLIAPENHNEVLRTFKTQLSQAKTTELIFQIINKDGKKLWVLTNAKLVKEEDGSELIFGTMVDITKTKRVFDVTLTTLQQYQIILSQTDNAIFELDCVNDRMFFSDNWDGILGYNPIQENFLSSIPVNPHIHPDDVEELRSRFFYLNDGGTYKTMEVRLCKTPDKYIWCLIRATAIYDDKGNMLKLVGIIINIDQDKRAANELKRRAEQDSLTPLLNQTTARIQSQEYLDSADPNECCAMLVIDLDNFKNINDNYGHLFGDEVLVKAAGEIKSLFRSRDIVARIGGDEFMVLMRGIHDFDLIQHRCKQLSESLDNILPTSEYEHTVSASIGVVFTTVQDKNYNELFAIADKALYEAKNLGKHRYVITNLIE